MIKFYIQVRVAYKKSKAYVLTPSRKKLGKQVAGGSRSALASTCLNDLVIKKHTLKAIRSTIRREIGILCYDKVNSKVMARKSQYANEQLPLATGFSPFRVPCIHQ